MLAYGREWVWRRTETFEFTSTTTVRRQMGVDFQLPRWPGPDMDMDADAVDAMVASCARHGIPVHVPLLTLAKEKLTDVDVFDEERRTLPLLTTDQNGRIAGNVLLGVALGVGVKEGWDSISGAVVDALSAIAQLPSEEAKLLESCLRDGLDAHEAGVSAYAPPAHGEDMRKEPALALHDYVTTLRTLGSEDPDELAKARGLLADDLLGGLTEKLANDFIVLVPLTGDPYARRVLKFAYEEALAHPKRDKAAPRIKRVWWWLAERCSWRPKEFAFSRIPVGTTESHHVEMVAPENTEIVRGVFEAYVPRQPADGGQSANRRPLAAEDSASHRARPDEVDRIDGTNPRRGHMQLRAVPAQAFATARVAFLASPTGLVNAAALVTLLNAALFFAGLDRVDDVAQEDAAAAILLAGPTLLAAYIARPGEHEMVSMMLSGVRAMVAASGFLVFVAAAAIAFGYKEDELLHDIWWWLRWPAGALALGVSWSWCKVHWPTLPSGIRSRARLATRADLRHRSRGQIGQ